MEIDSQKTAYVDLHIHSTASDGSLSPLQIIRTAKNIGLRAIAITDHDTVDGSAQAMASARDSGLEILSGIEISADYTPGTMHILGYLIDVDDPCLNETLRKLQKSRDNRNHEIIERLRLLGIDIRFDEVVEVSGGGQVGRPHIARVLVQKGAVQTMDEAFARFLKKSGPAYVPRYRLSPSEAIQTILRAGGVPVLAHPFTLNAKSEAELEAIIADLKQAGLKGLEVYYPDHSVVRTALYERLARRHGLLMTGGTDFHGAAKPGVFIGVGRGEMRIPYRLVEELKRGGKGDS